MYNNKAQAWGFDVMIATIIFIAGIIIFFIYSLNFPNESQDTLENLLYEGSTLADSLLTEGHPNNWDNSNVVKIGITTKNKVNQSKLDNLYNLVSTSQGYTQSKQILDTTNEYFFNFSEQILIQGFPIPENGIGRYPETTTTNMIKISRLTIYQNKPVSLDLFIWK